MARSTNGTSDYIDCGVIAGLSGLTTASMACWVYRSATGTTAGFGTNKSENRWSIVHGDDDKIYVCVESAWVGYQYTAVQSLSGWYHLVATFDGSQTSGFRSHLFVNGSGVSYVGGVGIEPAALASGGNNSEFLFGMDRDLGVNRYWAGRYAEAGVWNVVLSADEIVSLAKGFAPCMVRPGSLLSYWPILGRGSPEPDLKGSNPGTLTGTTTQDHPRIIRPSRTQVKGYASVATGFDYSFIWES